MDPHAWLKSKKRWLVSFITLDRIRRASPFVAFSLSIFLTYSLTPPTLILTLFLTLYIRRIMDTHAFLQSFRLLQKRLLRDPVPVFNCQNPRCKKASCTQCHAVWEALHICHERDQESFRLFVEKAMSAALVRTCPQCHIGFSKVDGCNKITCPNCKYVMCHLCRKDIRKEKYGHFCDHFRPIPGPCQKCTKCDLYKSKEDRQAVLEAAEKAKSEWIRRHPDAKNIDFSLAQVGPGL